MKCNRRECQLKNERRFADCLLVRVRLRVCSTKVASHARLTLRVWSSRLKSKLQLAFYYFCFRQHFFHLVRQERLGGKIHAKCLLLKSHHKQVVRLHTHAHIWFKWKITNLTKVYLICKVVFIVRVGVCLLICMQQCNCMVPLKHSVPAVCCYYNNLKLMQTSTMLDRLIMCVGVLRPTTAYTQQLHFGRERVHLTCVLDD